MPASTSTWPSTFFSAATLRVEAAVQALRIGALGSEPGRLQRRDDAAVGQHRAEQRHRLVDRADAQRRLAEPAAEQRGRRRRRLRHVDLEDRLGQIGAPGAEALEQLHAAERQRERARVAGDVLVGRARVEQRDARLRQRLRRVEGEREADRAGADHRQIQRRRGHREHVIRGLSAEVPAYYSPHPGSRVDRSVLPWR